MTYRWLATASLLIILGNTAKAEQEVDLSLELARAFVGACVQSLPDTGKIEAAAQVLGYKPLTGDMARMFAPAEASAEWSAWLVDRNPTPPYFLSISEGPLNGKMMKICGVANPSAPASSVIGHVARILGLSEPVEDSVDRGQRVRLWRSGNGDDEILVFATDANPMGQEGISLSAMMKAVD